MTSPKMLDLDAVLAHMSPLGRAEFDAAVGRARVEELEAENRQLRAQLAATAKPVEHTANGAAALTGSSSASVSPV